LIQPPIPPGTELAGYRINRFLAQGGADPTFVLGMARFTG
jgi:hypothetical protein